MKRFAFFAIFLPFLAAAVFSCADSDLPVIGVNEAGVTYYVKANGTPKNKAYLQLAVKAGSCDERDDQRGLAHFLEHMAFNGTRSYEGKELVAFLESMGVAFGPELNAYTSYNETVYELEVPTDKPHLLDKAIDILQEWAFHITLDQEQAEKERGVILEEKRLRNSAAMRAHRTMTDALFAGSLYADRDPIGTEESIASAGRARLLDFYTAHYTPQNMAVFIVGDIDAEAAVERLKTFAPAAASERTAAEADLTPGKSWAESAASRQKTARLAVPFDTERQITVFTDPELTGASLTVWRKRPPQLLVNEQNRRNDLIRQLGAGILSQTAGDLILSGESELISFTAYDSPFVRTLSVFGMEAALPLGDIETPLRQLIALLKGFGAGLCDEAKLQRAKQTALADADALEAQIPTYESLAYLNWYKDDWLNGHTTVSVADYVASVRRIVPTVTLSEINEMFGECFNGSDTVYSLAAPSFPFEEAEAQALIERLLAETEPFMPASPDAESEFFPYEPVPGSITGQRQVKEAGAVRYTLSNGITVWARPSDFKKNAVEMKAFQNGGLSLASKAEYASALLCADWFSRGGLGTMNSAELKAQMETRNAACSVTMDNLTHGFEGYAASDELETLFQLIYLYLMQPNPDEASFNLVRKAAVEAAEQRGNDPTETFFRRVNERLHNGNFRYLPLSAGEVRRAEAADAEAFYRRLFSASGFTFVFAGDFDPATLERYMERYLASVTFNTEALNADLSVYEPIAAEADKETVRKGAEPKAIVQLLFAGESPYSPAAALETAVLGRIIDMVMRDSIREDSSGAYATQGYGVLSRQPFEQFLVAAAFFCDPQRAETLTARAVSELNRLADNPRFSEYLRNSLEIERTSLASADRTNSRWIERLILLEQGALTPADIAGRSAAIDAVTSEKILLAAQTLMPSERLKIYTLLPE